MELTCSDMGLSRGAIEGFRPARVENIGRSGLTSISRLAGRPGSMLLFHGSSGPPLL